MKKRQLNRSVSQSVTAKYEKSAEQISFCKPIELNITTIPILFSDTKDHIQSNSSVFEFTLTDEEVQMINIIV